MLYVNDVLIKLEEKEELLPNQSDKGRPSTFYEGFLPSQDPQQTSFG